MAKPLFATLAALGLTAGAAHAATIVSFVGDIDGFGGQVSPGDIGADAGSRFDNRELDDPVFTDVWLFEQDGGEGGSPIDYTHDYTADAPIVSASLDIMTAGMADGRGPWSVLVNGNSVGAIVDGIGTLTTLFTFEIDVSFLNGLGSESISLVYEDTQIEGFAIDYSQLTLETSVLVLPLPAGLPLLVLGLGGLGLMRRRKAA